MLRAYMQDDITVKYNEGYTRGEPDATTDVEMKCYLKWGHHTIENIAGEKVIAKGIAYVMADRLLTNDDVIEHDSVRYVIVAIIPGKDFSENHQEVHLQ